MKKTLLKVLFNFDWVITCVMLAALILFTFLAVIMRYVVSRPVTWGEEFQLFAIVVVVFFGSGAAFRLGSHVAIDLIVDRLPQKAQKFIEIVMAVLSVLILAYFAFHSAGFVRQMYVTQRITNILRIPYFLTYATFPLGCVLMIINYLVSIYKRFSGAQPGRLPGEGASA
jgi:TRAP-type C4-dicarboxylate transport system permease small subunit